VSRRPQQRPVSLVLIAIGMLSLPALTCQGARTQARPLDPGQSTPDVVPGPDTLLRPDTLPGPGARLDPEGRRWVDTTLASLSLHEKAGQLLNIWMDGGYASSTDPEFRRIVGLVEEHGLGGVTVSIGLPYSYAAKLNALQARARVPLLVTADFEAGPGTRLGAVWAIPWMIPMGGGTEFPPAMGFGAIGDESYAYELGRVTAREARALGVHLNFAPVLDVNSNPANPIINTRSYGEDPQMVARLGVAYIRGMRDGGLMSTAKHFPGHGDTRTDSHLELPVVDADRTRLDTLELIPFRRAIEAGVDAVMTAHLSVPAVVEPDAPPATLSAALTTGLLREELGFEGLVFTDALQMGAIVSRYGGAEAAVRAVEAGADVVLMPEDPERAIAAIVAAVRSGRLSEARIDASVRRLLEAKAAAGLHTNRMVELERVADVVGVREHVAFAERTAVRSLTLARDREEFVPLDKKRAGQVFSLTLSRPADLAAGLAFDGRLGEAGLTAKSARITSETRAATVDSLAREAATADVVLVSVYLPPKAGEGSVDAPPTLARFVDAVHESDTPLVLLSFGSPYLLTELPDVRSYLLAWGGRPVSQRAAADALLGRVAIDGRLPISLPPFHRVGEGLTRPGPGKARSSDAEAPSGDIGMDPAVLRRVDALLESAVSDSITPGAALAVGRRGRLLRLRGYGALDWDEEASPVTENTLYDLASLTKVVGTTSAVLLLVQEGRVDLDAPVAAYLPEWGTGWKSSVTLRQLLLHRGGLPPFLQWWQELRGSEAYRAALSALEPAYEPGARTTYSDFGFITLGLVVEAASGRALDRFLATGVFEPLQMTDTGYRPDPALLDRVAPTEVDTAFRGTHLHGVVHDENAYAMGGVAGHAGLFSTARDLARFAEAWLAAAQGKPSGPFAPDAVAEFTRRHDGASTRALGWETPSNGSSAGRCLTERAFGHTGFTGTSLWIDPELDLFVVLLTNRVNPTRAERRHIPLRRAVHTEIAAGVRDAQASTGGSTAGVCRGREAEAKR
jgi:beta-glucosidase-like glycosyl hydrolase/CubicO group peptidase (beta-lactamase class C family)